MNEISAFGVVHKASKGPSAWKDPKGYNAYNSAAAAKDGIPRMNAREKKRGDVIGVGAIAATAGGAAYGVKRFRAMR